MTGFPGSSVVKNPHANAGDAGSIPGWEDPLEKKWQSTPILLPGKSSGQRSLWATVHRVTELDMTEHACATTT